MVVIPSARHLHAEPGGDFIGPGDEGEEAEEEAGIHGLDALHEIELGPPAQVEGEEEVGGFDLRGEPGLAVRLDGDDVAAVGDAECGHLVIPTAAHGGPPKLLVVTCAGVDVGLVDVRLAEGHLGGCRVQSEGEG